MTEYTSSPEAIEQYMTQRERLRYWLSSSSTSGGQYPPSIAPSLNDGSVWGDYEPSECGSSHSIPPTMMLHYADNRKVFVTPDGYEGKHRRKQSAELGSEDFSTRSLSPAEPVSSASASDSRSRSRSSTSPSRIQSQPQPPQPLPQTQSVAESSSSMRRLPSRGPEAIFVRPPNGEPAGVTSSIVSREHSSSSHSHSQNSHSREFHPIHRSHGSQNHNSIPHTSISPVPELPQQILINGTAYPPLPSSHASQTPTHHTISLNQNEISIPHHSQNHHPTEPQQTMILSSPSSSQNPPLQILYSQSHPQSYSPSNRTMHRRGTHPPSSVPSPSGRPLPVPSVPTPHPSQMNVGSGYRQYREIDRNGGPSIVYAPSRKSNMQYAPPSIMYASPQSRKSGNGGSVNGSASVGHDSSLGRRGGNGTPYPSGSIMNGNGQESVILDKYGTARAAEPSRFSIPKRSLFSSPFRPGSSKSSAYSSVRDSRPSSSRSRLRSATIPDDTPRSHTPDSMYSRSSVSTYYVLPKRGQKVHVINPDTRSIHGSYGNHSSRSSPPSPTSAHLNTHHSMSTSQRSSRSSSWFMRPLQRFFTFSPQNVQHQSHASRSESHGHRYSEKSTSDRRHRERRDTERRGEERDPAEGNSRRMVRRNSSET